MQDTLIPTDKLNDGQTNNARLRMRLTASKRAHERAAERLKQQATQLTGERKLTADKKQLEHLRQANFIAEQLKTITV